MRKRIDYNSMQGRKSPPSKEEASTQVPPPLGARKSSTSTQCDICFQSYHILGKWPIIACPNQHFFCDHCVQGLLALNNDEPVPCPMCRALIRKANIKPHVQLFRTLNQEGTVKDALKEESNELFLYAFQFEIFEIASLFKENKMDQLKNIQRLDLSSRNINKIQHLTMLQSLNALHLQNNLLVSVKGLQELPNLKIINLNHNKLTDVDSLGLLPKLQNLAVQFNRIRNINLMSLSKLKHIFLFGNLIGANIVDQLLMIQFPKLITLSFSINDLNKKTLNKNFLESLPISETLSGLKKIIVQSLFQEWVRIALQNQVYTNNGLVEIVWIGEESFNSLAAHQKWLGEFFRERHHYGQAFKFIVDISSPNLNDYRIEGKRVTKRTGNFTSLNSAYPIPKQGKQSFKFRIVQPSQHFFVGIANAFQKHTSNIYSQHFVGLTFWGTIYSRGDTFPISGKVRYEDRPTIRITLDFEEQTIKWYSDEQLIGFVPLSPQFKYSQLFFVFGMRDTDTSIDLLDQ